MQSYSCGLLVLMKSIPAERQALAKEEQKAKWQGQSLDRGASGGEWGPSHPSPGTPLSNLVWGPLTVYSMTHHPSSAKHPGSPTPLPNAARPHGPERELRTSLKRGEGQLQDASSGIRDPALNPPPLGLDVPNLDQPRA